MNDVTYNSLFTNKPMNRLFLIETFQFIDSPDMYLEMYESDQPAVRILKSKSAKGAKKKVDGAQGAEGS